MAKQVYNKVAVEALIEAQYVGQTSKFVASEEDITGLLNKIGYTINQVSDKTDHLQLFDDRVLEFGAVVEEYFVEDLAVVDFDPTSTPFNKDRASIISAYHYPSPVGKKVELPVPLKQMERAFTNAGDFAKLIASLNGRIQSSKNMYKYAKKKDYLAEKIYRNGSSFGLTTFQDVYSGTNIFTDPITTVKSRKLVVGGSDIPQTAEDMEVFIKNIKKLVERMQFSTAQFNEKNVLVESQPNDLVLLIKTGILPDIAVDVLATAFNKGELATGVSQVVFDYLPTPSDDTDEIASSSWAVLIDKRAIRYITIRNTTEIDRNGNALYYLITHHFDETIVDSLTANMVAFSSVALGD